MALPRLIGALVLGVVLPAGRAGAPVAQDAVEPGVQDVGPLSESLRRVEPGLHDPGFERVYRLEAGAAAPGAPRPPARYMRVQGALHAVFPESVYVRDREGRRVAVVPANTVFMIGEPPEPAAPPPRRYRERVDLQVGPDARPGPIAAAGDTLRPAAPALRELAARSDPRPAAEAGEDLPRIAADAAYRAERLSALLHQAAAAESQAARGRSSSSK